jgi:glycerol uptake facilitator-like aquaporin
VTTARRLTAELVGTFELVFAGCGAVMVEAKTGALGHVGVAITFALVIMAMISLGNIAHVGATLPPGSERQSFLWSSCSRFS